MKYTFSYKGNLGSHFPTWAFLIRKFLIFLTELKMSLNGFLNVGLHPTVPVKGGENVLYTKI